jgi:hypothetical protein
MITPILLTKSAFGAYFLFGGLALGTVAVLAAYMPETRGQSLESIQEAFRRPMVKSWNLFASHRSHGTSNPEIHQDVDQEGIRMSSLYPQLVNSERATSIHSVAPTRM